MLTQRSQGPCVLLSSSNLACKLRLPPICSFLIKARYIMLSLFGFVRDSNMIPALKKILVQQYTIAELCSPCLKEAPCIGDYINALLREITHPINNVFQDIINSPSPNAVAVADSPLSKFIPGYTPRLVDSMRGKSIKEARRIWEKNGAPNDVSGGEPMKYFSK
jgi:hypothetical protein